MRRGRLFVLTPALALLVAVPAAAGDHLQWKLTAAGNAAARRVALTRSDIPPGPGWTSHTTTSTASSNPACGTYRPKQSDLVGVGQVDVEWSHTGLHLASEVTLLKTGRMVRLDWQRAVGSPRFLGCARTAAQRTSDPSLHFVSLVRMPFPRVATYVSAFRVTFDHRRDDGTMERLISDVVFIGKARTELTLTVLAARSHAASLPAIEEILARRMVGRMET
jgi:hypothetical protein